MDDDTSVRLALANLQHAVEARDTGGAAELLARCADVRRCRWALHRAVAESLARR